MRTFKNAFFNFSVFFSILVCLCVLWWRFVHALPVSMPVPLIYIYDPRTGYCFAETSNGLTTLPCSTEILEQAGALKPTARF